MTHSAENARRVWKWLYLTVKELHPTRGLRVTPLRDGGDLAFYGPGASAEPFAWLDLGEDSLRLRLGDAKAPGEVVDGFAKRELRSKEVVPWLRVRLERGLPAALEVAHTRDAKAYVETWRVVGELAARLGAWPRPVFVDHSGFVDDPSSRRHSWWGRVVAQDPLTGCYGFPGLVLTDRGLIYNRTRQVLDVLLATDGLASEALLAAVLAHRDTGGVEPVARAGGAIGPALSRFTWFSRTEPIAAWQGDTPYSQELEVGPFNMTPDAGWNTWRYDGFDRPKRTELDDLTQLVNTWGYTGSCSDRIDPHVTPLATADGRFDLAVTPSPGVLVKERRTGKDSKIDGDAGGHPHTGAVHPTQSLVAVFSRRVSVIDVAAGAQVFSFPSVEGGCDGHRWSRSGTFHPGGRFLLWVSSGGIACCDLETWSVREVLRNDPARGSAYGGPLHCSPRGDYLLLNTPGGPASFRWEDLERAFARAPEVLPFGL